MADKREPLPVHPTYRLRYWAVVDNAYRRAASASDGDVVCVETPDGPYGRMMEFEWPADYYKARMVCLMLARAYELGDLAARADIRKCLGVQEVRR